MAKEKIGVVGAGLMGAEIALVFALAGHDVLLSDRSEDYLKAALTRLGGVLDRGIPRGFFKEEDKPLALSRIATTLALADFADRDLVADAVFEDEAIKAEIYRSCVAPTASSRATPRRSRSPRSRLMSARRGGRALSVCTISRRPRA